MLPHDSDDWFRVLCECGVDASVARARSASFAQTIREGTFSAGIARELPDFLATILHESGMLAHLRENGNYSERRIRELSAQARPGTRWATMGARAAELEGKPNAFFEALYGGRLGNGPEGSGDGARFPGRAYIGVTGRDNYAWLSDLVGQDLTVNPQLAEQPIFALEFTIAWWEGRVPDRILGDERAVRRVVNGGYIGMDAVSRLSKCVRGVLCP